MTEQVDKIMGTVAGLDSALGVLSWDQETFMPEQAVQARAQQLAVLSGLRHHELTNDEARTAIDKVMPRIAELSARKQKVVLNFVEEQQRASKLPAAHIEKITVATTLGQDAWKRAKQAKDFSLFKQSLEEITDLKRREADLLGYQGHPYNAMLDIYEPGLSVDQLNPVFSSLATSTNTLLNAIQSSGNSVSNAVLYRAYPNNQQLEFATWLVQQLGFSMQTGRVDLSAHPFCTHFDRTDVRLTTRIREHDLRSCLFGLIHESGHGMYEQGVNAELSGTLSGQGASMGIHESQSLFWENIIGRSEEFWQWAFPKLRQAFPEQLADQTAETFYKAINVMQASLNRVESDELTYNLHIILRFEIERDLMDGTLTVADIPAAWNEKMKTLLGVVPDSDDEGCLQDVHWSFGGIGYFPSYTLGKLYSAMFWNTLQRAIPDAKEQISKGQFADILSWLRVNIHDYGKTEKPAEIVMRVCQRPLTESDFVSYVTNKAQHVYGF